MGHRNGTRRDDTDIQTETSTGRVLRHSDTSTLDGLHLLDFT